MAYKKQPALTKDELVNYIGPIFQELKTDIFSVEKKLTDKINSVESKLTENLGSVERKLTADIYTVEKKLNDKINWDGTLTEQMGKALQVVLERTEMLQTDMQEVKKNLKRLDKVEAEVAVIKTVLKNQQLN
jgi:polyhydroxyalkanoate synthesis regulator phasin